MALDPRIALAGRPGQFSLQDFATGMQQGQQFRAVQLELSEAERAAQEAEAIRQAYAQQYGGGGGAPPGLAGAQPMQPPGPEAPVQERQLGGSPSANAPYATPPPGGPQARQTMGLAGVQPMTPADQQSQRGFIDKLYTISPKAGREAETHAFTSQKQQYEANKERVEYLGRIANGVLDSPNPQQAWTVARAMLIEAGMPPGQVPEVVDLNYVQQLSGMALDAKDKYNAGILRLQQDKEQRERNELASKAPDYGYGQDLDAALYARYGTQLPPGSPPTPAMVQQARQDLIAEKRREDQEKQQGRVEVAAATGREAARLSQEKPLEGEAAKAVSELTAMQTMTDDVTDMFSTDYTGQFAGRWGAVKQWTGNASQREVVFRRVVNDMKDQLLRARSGAAITQSEYERLSNLVPNLTDPPTTFQAKLLGFRRGLDQSKAARLQTATTGRGSLREQSGDITPLPAAAPALSEADITYYMQTWGKTRQEVLDAVRATGSSVPAR